MTPSAQTPTTVEEKWAQKLVKSKYATNALIAIMALCGLSFIMGLVFLMAAILPDFSLYILIVGAVGGIVSLSVGVGIGRIATAQTQAADEDRRRLLSKP